MKVTLNFFNIFTVLLGTILFYPSFQVLMASLLCSNTTKFPYTKFIDNCYRGMHGWMAGLSIIAFIILLATYSMVKLLLRELNPHFMSPFGQFQHNFGIFEVVINMAVPLLSIIDYKVRPRPLFDSF